MTHEREIELIAELDQIGIELRQLGRKQKQLTRDIQKYKKKYTPPKWQQDFINVFIEENSNGK